MKISLLLRYKRVLLRRRNKAQRDYSKGTRSIWDIDSVRRDTEVIVLDKVLDDLERLVKRNTDHWHDRRKR